MIVFSYLLISLRFKNRQVYSIYQATLCSRFLLQSFLNPFEGSVLIFAPLDLWMDPVERECC